MSMAATKLTTMKIEESVTSKPTNVDRVAGIIENVKIVGLSAPSKKRDYTPDALKNAIPLYEGLKVNVNHVDPNAKSRKFEDRIGRLSGIYFKEGEGLFAKKFAFNPEHPLAKSLCWWAENDPAGVGFSQHAGGRGRVVRGRQIVEAVDAVSSVDLVADPATTAGLFESEEEGEDMDLKTLTIAELKESRQDLFDLILSESKETVKITDLQKQIKDLTESLEVYKMAEQRSKLLTKAKEACVTAKMEKAAITDVFLESLVAVAEDKWSPLIEDRKAIYGPGKRSTTPKSSEQTDEDLIESEEDDDDDDLPAMDSKKLAKLYR